MAFAPATVKTIFPRMYVRAANSLDQMTLSEKFTLGLLIMLPHGNHVKQVLELIHFLLLYEYFNRV